MTQERKPIEITKELWEAFLESAEKAMISLATDITKSDTSEAAQLAFTTAVIVPQLRKCLPIPARDAEQLPHLRLKRKNQRKAYRDLQLSYERVRQWWIDSSRRNGTNGNGVYQAAPKPEHSKNAS